MINIHDNRKTNEVRLSQIELDGYFMFGHVLCRRIWFKDNDGLIEGVPFIEIPTGKVSGMDRMIWVEPIRDEQICLSIEDWG